MFGRGLLLPLWLTQVLTSAKSFERNPVLGNRWLNERGLHRGRVRLAHRMAAMRRRRLARLIPPEDVERLDRDGFIVKENFLPPALFSELLAQARAIRAPAREMAEGDTITRHIALDPRLLAELPAARRMLDDARWRNLLAYAGSSAAAPLVYLQTILTRSVDGPADPQMTFHADTFHPTMKAWFFLGGAPADAAPFIYIPGSHRLTPERLAWEQRMACEARGSDESENRQGSFRAGPDALAAMRLPPPSVLDAKANTLIVADTFGFHARGPSRHSAARVEIWAFGRRNPFLPWVGLDPWSWRDLALWKPRLYWRLLDALEAFGLGRARWRKCGRKSPFDPAVAPGDPAIAGRPVAVTVE